MDLLAFDSLQYSDPAVAVVAKMRMNVPAVFLISLVVNVGMWLERFVIVVTSLTRDFVPSSWGMYYPTIWDWSTYLGTIGLFLSLMFLFIRGLPAISIFEMREVVHELEPNMLTETKVSHEVEIYGLMAEFSQPEPLLDAARRAHAEGYRKMDAYSPMPVEGLAEAIGFRSSWVQRLVLVGGLLGATGGFTLCWWMTSSRISAHRRRKASE